MDVPISARKEIGHNSEEILKSLEETEKRTEPVDTKNILVWWDIETCPIPSATRGPSQAATCLLQELQRHVTCDDICVMINVYGNGGPCSKTVLDALITGGITLQHRILPCKQPGSESAALKTMIVDIALWALSNPAPANIFLISASRDTSFRDLVSGLHARDYNILLATKFNFGCEASPTDSDVDASQVQHQFHPMPRHWSVAKQLFVARTSPSDANSSPNVQLPEKIHHLHIHPPRP